MIESVQKQTILRFYEYFYSKLTANNDFVVHLNKKEKISLDNYIKIISKEIKLESIGEEFWYDYFCFQFEFWRTKYTRLGKNKVKFNWVIGKESWKRWNSRVECFRYFHEIGFVKMFDIKKSDLIKIQKTNIDFTQIRPIEELIKSSKYNTKEGFQNCIMLTELYNEKSELCQNCIEKDLCIEIKNK